MANTSVDLCDLGKIHGHTVIAMAIDMLPDNVFLDIIDFLSNRRIRLHPVEMEEIGARMSKMATGHICITNPSPYPTLLHKRDSCQVISGSLVSLSYQH